MNNIFYGKSNLQKKNSPSSSPSAVNEKSTELGHDLTEKEETIKHIYMLIVGYVVIVSFGYWFHSYFRKLLPDKLYYTSIFFVIIMPSILYSYYIFYEINQVREHVSHQKILEEVKYEIEKEEKISGIIPIILFGVGIVYSNIQKVRKSKVNLLQLSSPYLLFSLIFGTVIPNIISYLVFDNNNLQRMLIASKVDFVSVSISFGLMIVSLVVPFFTHYDNI